MGLRCLFVYLMTLSVSKLHSVYDRRINEYGAYGGMRTGRENGSTRRRTTSVTLSIIYPGRLDLDMNPGHRCEVAQTSGQLRVLVSGFCSYFLVAR
jgi:hypothetical protein